MSRDPQGFTRLHKATLKLTLVLAAGGMVFLALPSTIYVAESHRRDEVRTDGSQTQPTTPVEPQLDPDEVEGRRPEPRKSVEPVGGDPRVDRQELGLLVGELVDARGIPLPNRRVWAEAVDDWDTPGVQGREQTTSGADGRFSLEVRAGSWRVRTAEVISARVVAVPNVETRVVLPPIPKTVRWRVLLQGPGDRALDLPSALVTLRLPNRAELTGRGQAVADDSVADQVGVTVIVTPGLDLKGVATADLVVQPGDPRYRGWRGQVALPREDAPIVVKLQSAPYLKARLILAASHSSATVSVYALDVDTPLLQRTGVGLRAKGDADPTELLWRGSGVVRAREDGAREVTLRLGLDLRLPTTVLVAVTAHGPRRPGSVGTTRGVHVALPPAGIEPPVVDLDLR